MLTLIARRTLSSSNNVKATVARGASASFAEYRSKHAIKTGPLYAPKIVEAAVKPTEVKAAASKASA